MASQPPQPPRPPEGFESIYAGPPLPAFYVADLLRGYVGQRVWAADAAGRTRCGKLVKVPAVREDSRAEPPPVEFADERPLYLRQIVALAVYTRRD